MTIAPTTAPFDLRRVRARIPQHVVYRPFPAETVVLNLESGVYHGLNPTAGRMLVALQGAMSIAEAAAELELIFPAAAERIEPDLRKLCGDLRDLGLLVLEPVTSAAAA